MHDLINKELKVGNIINTNQHGFMENRYCQTDLISLLMKLQLWLGERNSLIVICQHLRQTPQKHLKQDLGRLQMSGP